MVMGLGKEKALKLLDGRVWEMHLPEDCGQKTKNVVPGTGAGHARCQNTRGRRPESTSISRTSQFARPHCSLRHLFAICRHPPNALLPPSPPTVHASAVEAGFDGGSAAGVAQPTVVGSCQLKGEGGFVVQVTFVYVLSASFALERSTEMFWLGGVFAEAP